jgi:hypothetical protein
MLLEGGVSILCKWDFYGAVTSGKSTYTKKEERRGRRIRNFLNNRIRVQNEQFRSTTLLMRAIDYPT